MRFSSLLIVVLLLGINSVHAKGQKLRFSKCDARKVNRLTAATRRALDQIGQMQIEFNEVVDRYKNYSSHEVSQLKAAHRKIACIERKLPKMHYKCANKKNPRALAWTIPVVGMGVKIFDEAFYDWISPLYAILIHEVAHKCTTNDRTYYAQLRRNPNQDKDKRWAHTASIYDWWATRRFCIPGRDC